MPSYLHKEVTPIDKVYYWMFKITLAEEEEERREFLNKLQEAVNGLTHEDIVRNRSAKHPILHESAHQLLIRTIRKPEWLDAFKIIWMDPKFVPFWDNREYLDKYYQTAKERLQKEIEYQENDPDIEFIRKKILKI